MLVSSRNKYLLKLKKLPFLLLFFIVSTCILGFVVLYSAAGGHLMPWAYKQIINFCLFLPLSIFLASVDLKIVFRLSYVFYFIILLLLVGVELFGSIGMGAKRWVDFGIMRMQPSEPIKLAIVVMLARYFHLLAPEDIFKTHKILIAIIATLIPVGLVIKQPDLGTGIVTILVASMIFFAAGIQIWKFILSFGAVIGCIPIIWSQMYDYQRKRVLFFLDPEKDHLGGGYNIIQSKIAIGSGGLFGKGLKQGTQSHLDFLPEHQTDFIFASFAEEFGFIGGILLIIFYICIIFFALIVAANCKHLFGKLLTIGVVAIFFSHVFINIAMVMGVLPVVGVPLPLVSYGGTMMASMLLGFGLVMNVHVNQRNNNVI